MTSKYTIEVHGYNQRGQLSAEHTLMVPVEGLDLDPRVRANAMLTALTWLRQKVPGLTALTGQIISVETPEYIG